MSLITRTIPSLMNGISQQPAILRSSDQTEDELNTWSHVAEGLTRRPPTQVITKITGLAAGASYGVHKISRDISEHYFVIWTASGLSIYDAITGAAKTVTSPHGRNWVSTGFTPSQMRALSVADYTFIINTTTAPTLKAVGADQTAAPTDYRLPGGTTPSSVTPTGTGYVVTGSDTQYIPNPTYSGGLTGTVPSMDKLPDPPCSGCVYKVLGQNETSFVSYYVRGDGVVWNETVAPGLLNGITETTLPFALIREATGNFTFAPFSWHPRRVGDESTNPAPPFIGRTIRDAFFYQNRLGFVVDDGVVFSAAGDYGDFWRRTVLDYIDSDALAASAATTDVNILDYALPFADGVMLFSRQKQFSLTNGDSGLSAHSLAIAPVTQYVMAAGVRPTPMGSQAHFLSDARGFSAVQEYTRLAGADPTEAADITAHVPHLIPQGASEIIPLHDLDALVILMGNASTAAQKSTAFAYQFYWDGDKKLQSAWRPWDFIDGTPRASLYENGAIYILMDRSDGLFLEKIDLAAQAVSANQDHLIYLDRQVSKVGTYNAGTNRTTFALGYVPDMTRLQIIRGKGTTAPESVINPTGYILAGTSVSVPGDESGHAATIGQTFVTKTVPSRQFPLDWQNRPLTTGRLQLHTFTLNMTNSAYLRAEVYPYGTDAQALEAGLVHTTLFNPAPLGSALSVIGQRNYADTTFTFSVAGNAAEARVELINDTAFGHTITSAEWEGLFFSRAL